MKTFRTRLFGIPIAIAYYRMDQYYWSAGSETRHRNGTAASFEKALAESLYAALEMGVRPLLHHV